jgi:hypothetical protein
VKVVTVLGTRPEIIRLSQVIARLDPLCEQTLVHTGQNYDPALSDIFFSELGVRPPDCYLGVRGESFAARVGQIFVECESVLRQIRPDRLLILGDTDSALCGFIAKRLGVPVYHMMSSCPIPSGAGPTSCGRVSRHNACMSRATPYLKSCRRIRRSSRPATSLDASALKRADTSC